MVDVLAVGSGVGEPLEALGALERLLTRVEPAVLRSKERCEIPFDKKDLQLQGSAKRCFLGCVNSLPGCAWL